MSRQDWAEGALCTTTDPEIFYPNPDLDWASNKYNRETALKICAECDVRDKCLEVAVENMEWKGIWGGTTEKQRAPMIRERHGLGEQEIPEPEVPERDGDVAEIA